MSTLTVVPGGRSEQDLPDVVVENIRVELARKGLKQGVLADILGTSTGGVSARMKGKQEFKLSEIATVARALGVSRYVLLGGVAPYRDGGDDGPGASSSMAEQRTFNPKVAARRIVPIEDVRPALPHAA